MNTTQMTDKLSVRALNAISDVPADLWNGLAEVVPGRTVNPFTRHEFLSCLEDSGCVGGLSGWAPHHVIVDAERNDAAAEGVLGAMPCYVKSHSQGEYIFDHGWADAYERAGGRYYPKLQAAVPFTPVSGPRFLIGSGPGHADRRALLAHCFIELARNSGLSSAHATFCTMDEWKTLGGTASNCDLLSRSTQQFHWLNRGYQSFDDFLAALSSRKRKTVRKERSTVRDHRLDIRHLTGKEITEAHWDAFFDFYLDTGLRKWGRPYLNRRFFSLLGERMGNDCLLILAERAGRPVAGALHVLSTDCIYGRYWGAVEHHPCLHFELCYYQAIEYAITHGMSRVEAGAQGEHKLLRGYEPVETYSLHWISDPGFRRAVARFLNEERRHIAEQREMLAEYLPFKRGKVEED